MKCIKKIQLKRKIFIFSAPGGLYPTINPQPKYDPRNEDDNPPRAHGHKPAYQKSEEDNAFGNCLDKVGLAVGGLVAAGGVAAAMHAINVCII